MTYHGFFGMFAQLPPAENVKELAARDFGDEKLAFTRTLNAASMHIPGAYGRADSAIIFWK